MLYTHAAAVLIGLAIGASGAWQVRSWKAAADDAARLRADNATALRRAERVDQAAQGLEEARGAIRAQTEAITQEVDHVVAQPSYRDRECLDPDGLRLVAAAVAGSAPAASQPAPAVPASGVAP